MLSRFTGRHVTFVSVSRAAWASTTRRRRR